jgi:4-aminobutyrate aminotransferase-like enzyme
MAHAQALGKYFIQQLKTLQQSYPCIGDVRGKGLFIGVELVDDCISHKPNPNLTKIMINHFKNNNIILSSDGPHNNVFKIKPPLTIQQPDIENFIRVLTDGLKQFS